MKLSILILSTAERVNYLTNLLAILKPQLVENEVELVMQIDDGEATIGEKRNEALAKAEGKYICYIDDDDEVAPNYVELILNAIKNDPDCCSLIGVYTVDGINHAAVSSLAPLIQQDNHFPESVNVGFMQIINDQKIKLRVYERGAGETLACGSGASNSARGYGETRPPRERS